MTLLSQMSNIKVRKITVLSRYNGTSHFLSKRERHGVWHICVLPRTFPFITSPSAATSPQEPPPLCCRNSYRKCHVVIPLFCSRGIRDYENLSSTRIIRNARRRKSQREAPECSWCLKRSQFLFFFHSFVLLLFHPLLHLFSLLRLGFHYFLSFCQFPQLHVLLPFISFLALSELWRQQRCLRFLTSFAFSEATNLTSSRTFCPRGAEYWPPDIIACTKCTWSFWRNTIVDMWK